MKKLCLIMFAILGTLFATLTIAEQLNAVGYFTSDHAQASENTAVNRLALTMDPTEIRVLNAKGGPIFIDYPTKDQIDSGEKKFIRHTSSKEDIRLILKDQQSNIIFNNVVCHYAQVTVIGDGAHIVTVKC